jgi:hypothetical protein
VRGDHGRAHEDDDGPGRVMMMVVKLLSEW